MLPPARFKFHPRRFFHSGGMKRKPPKEKKKREEKKERKKEERKKEEKRKRDMTNIMHMSKRRRNFTIPKAARLSGKLPTAK